MVSIKMKGNIVIKAMIIIFDVLLVLGHTVYDLPLFRDLTSCVLVCFPLPTGFPNRPSGGSATSVSGGTSSSVGGGGVSHSYSGGTSSTTGSLSVSSGSNAHAQTYVIVKPVKECAATLLCASTCESGYRLESATSGGCKACSCPSSHQVTTCKLVFL